MPWEPLFPSTPQPTGPLLRDLLPNDDDVAGHLAELVQRDVSLPVLVPRRPVWHADAACRGRPVNLWFPTRGESSTAALDVCAGCPVVVDCAVAGYSDGETHGIWGGLSERKRRASRSARLKRLKARREPWLILSATGRASSTTRPRGSPRDDHLATGLSLLAIASATGASLGTVHEDTAGVQNRTPDDEPSVAGPRDAASRPAPGQRGTLGTTTTKWPRRSANCPGPGHDLHGGSDMLNRTRSTSPTGASDPVTARLAELADADPGLAAIAEARMDAFMAGDHQALDVAATVAEYLAGIEG